MLLAAPARRVGRELRFWAVASESVGCEVGLYVSHALDRWRTGVGNRGQKNDFFRSQKVREPVDTHVAFYLL